MGAAGWVALVVCAQVETASVGTSTRAGVETSSGGESLDSLLAEIGDDPLSSAELEMLRKLGSATATVARTATMAWAAPEPVLRPWHRTKLRARRETVARSTREALDALALPAVSFRASRRRVLYEGMLLAPLAEGVLDADLRMFDRVEVMSSSSRRDHSRGGAGTIALFGPKPERGIHPEAAIEARSADRSTGVFAAVDGGVDVVRGRAAIGYDDLRALRTPEGSEPRNAQQRWLASVRGAILGGEGDLVGIELGGDLDRAHNTRIVDRDGKVRGVAGLDQRALAFARLDLRAEKWGLSLLGGYQGLRQNQVLDQVAMFDVDADLFQARASVVARALDWLRFDIDGHFVLGSGTAPQKATRREIEASFFTAVSFDAFQAEAGVRIANQESADDAATRALPQVDLHLPIAGPIGLRAAFDMGMTLPGSGLFAPPSAFRDPETSITVEAGPTLRGNGYWADLTAFSSWIRNPLEPPVDPTPSVPRSQRIRALGIELDGAFVVIQDFDVAFTMNVAEAIDRDSGRAAYAVPVLSGLLALRYRFGFQNAHVALHARGATAPLRILGDEPIDGWILSGRRPRAFVRVGITGGLEIGAGFAIDLAVENAIDRTYQLHTSDAVGGGLDVRAALSWRY